MSFSGFVDHLLTPPSLFVQEWGCSEEGAEVHSSVARTGKVWLSLGGGGTAAFGVFALALTNPHVCSTVVWSNLPCVAASVASAVAAGVGGAVITAIALTAISAAVVKGVAACRNSRQYSPVSQA